MTAAKIQRKKVLFYVVFLIDAVCHKSEMYSFLTMGYGRKIRGRKDLLFIVQGSKGLQLTF